MSRVPSPADLAASAQPMTAEQLRDEYTELIDEVTAAGSEQDAAVFVEKLEQAHTLLQDALSERNS